MQKWYCCQILAALLDLKGKWGDEKKNVLLALAQPSPWDEGGSRTWMLRVVRTPGVHHPFKQNTLIHPF